MRPPTQTAFELIFLLSPVVLMAARAREHTDTALLNSGWGSKASGRGQIHNPLIPTIWNLDDEKPYEQSITSGQNLRAFRWGAKSVIRQLIMWIKLGKSPLKGVPSSGSQYSMLSDIITPRHWWLPKRPGKWLSGPLDFLSLSAKLL